jgi:AcrR family transcriptional regulator
MKYTLSSMARPVRAETPGAATSSEAPGRKLRRPERRELVLEAATRAFARNGYAATSLDEVALEAGISKVILYRHFESKADLYRAVLKRSEARLTSAVGEGDFTMDTLGVLLAAAAADPNGFRLLFRHAAREPEFRAEMDRFRAQAVATALRQLRNVIEDPAWAAWAAQLAPTIAVDAVIAWLDAGQPDRERAAQRIGHVLSSVVEAASFPGREPA